MHFVVNMFYFEPVKFSRSQLQPQYRRWRSSFIDSMFTIYCWVGHHLLRNLWCCWGGNKVRTWKTKI